MLAFIISLAVAGIEIAGIIVLPGPHTHSTSSSMPGGTASASVWITTRR
jgi:hypothetical protein